MPFNPSPCAHSSKMRRMTAASSCTISRLTVLPLRFPVRPWCHDVDVPVAEARSACYMTRFRLSQHRIIRALSCLLPLQFIRECRQGKHDLVGGGVERPLTIFEIEKHADAGLHDLVLGLPALASQRAERSAYAACDGEPNVRQLEPGREWLRRGVTTPSSVMPWIHRVCQGELLRTT